MGRWGERVAKICPTCNVEFWVRPNAKAIKQTYCSVKCRTIARTTIPIHNCKWCDKEFQPKHSDRTSYCSTECKIMYKAAVKVARGNAKPVSSAVAFAACPVCGEWFRQMNSNHTLCSSRCRHKKEKERVLNRNSLKKMSKIYKCKACGREMIKNYGDKARSACSDECKAKMEREDRYRTKQARRARKKQAFVAVVNRKAIYDRDNWTCQICGKKIKRSAIVPHPLAPTLDHIIPLAVGGTHEPRNVQCAHFICNSRKSHTGSGDQLRLIG